MRECPTGGRVVKVSFRSGAFAHAPTHAARLVDATPDAASIDSGHDADVGRTLVLSFAVEVAGRRARSTHSASQARRPSSDGDLATIEFVIELRNRSHPSS